VQFSVLPVSPSTHTEVIVSLCRNRVGPLFFLGFQVDLIGLDEISVNNAVC
jgi:hypothetical protein